MKWNSSSFLENRTFDQRLVKENLIDKWNIYGDIYKTRTDYRQFLESYVIINKLFSFFLFQFYTLLNILTADSIIYSIKMKTKSVIGILNSLNVLRTQYFSVQNISFN